LLSISTPSLCFVVWEHEPLKIVVDELCALRQ
jgi:hypothetical protein